METYLFVAVEMDTYLCVVVFLTMFFFFNRYKLTMDCWKEDPNERPSFAQLIPILEEMMTEDTPYYYFRLLDQNQPCYREASATNTSKTSTLDTKL